MRDAELLIRADDDGVRFTVKVVPGASRTKIVGVMGDALKIAVAAAPARGAANASVIALLAETLHCREADIQIVRGLTNPRKELRITGKSIAEVRGRLPV